MFEMLVGIPPFNADSVQEIFENIKNMIIPWDQIEIGYGENKMTPEAKVLYIIFFNICKFLQDLIDQLLQKSPEDRITAFGTQPMKNHPFFKGRVFLFYFFWFCLILIDINWETLKTTMAPIIPKINEVDYDFSNKLTENEKKNPFLNQESIVK